MKTLETDSVIREYTQFVKRIAKSMKAGLPPSVDIEDLVSAGLVGLWKASKNYSPEKAKFKTYAERRVRGEILDELRRTSIVPRRVQANANRIKKARKELGGNPDKQAVADKIGVAVRTLEKWERDSLPMDFVTLDETQHNTRTTEMASETTREQIREITRRRTETILFSEVCGRVATRIFRDEFGALVATVYCE